MGTHTKKYGYTILLFLLISCFLWNCGDKKEALKASIVSQKITAPKAAHSENKSVLETQANALAHKPEAKGVVEEKAILSGRIYDPAKRVNPFSPLFKTEIKAAANGDPGAKAPKKKRTPKTPLEKIGIDQLKLVATIRAPSGNKGLVEDNRGKGYIIKNGTYIGLHSGIVTQISADHVVIEEEKEDLMGKMVLRNTEIKLQKPAGE